MRDRAVSEVLGYILVFSLVMTMVTVVTATGLPALESTQEAQQSENALTAMNILSDNVEDVYRRGAPSRATEIDLHQAQLTTADHVDITITLEDTSTGATKTNTWITRPLVYEGRSGTSLVYEAGGLFLVQNDGGFTHQQPPFVVQLSGGTERVSIPIIRLTAPNAASVGGTTTYVRTGAASTSRPEVWHHETGGTGYDRIEIAIDSPRHELWADYLDDELSCSTTGTTVTCGYTSSDQLDAVSVVTHEIPVTLES